MIFKSIRWRLQIWYGLILTVVLAGFGFTSYQLERGRQFRRIDEELQRRVGVLATVMRQPPGLRRPGGPPEGRERGPGEPPIGRPPLRGDQLLPQGPFGEDRERRAPSRPDGGLFPDPRGGPDSGPQSRPPPDFRLPSQFAPLFDESDTNSFYYILWSRDGNQLAGSANLPAAVPRPLHTPPPAETSGLPNPRPYPQPPRTRGTFREAFIVTPPGEVILAGRSIAPELRDLRLAAWRLAAVGGGVLLLGLAGGWWIATRAIRPIEGISATATKIAGGDLSQRISAADTENELGWLASVLNSTFARLEAAFAQQGRFTADAAHELRTPVSVILTQTQATLARERDAAEYRETVEACQRAAQRMRRLTESLLELARLDAGQETMKRGRFDLANTVRDCVELVRPLADERCITIHCDFAALECEGDSERLAQVVTNLLGNAVQYNKDRGGIRVAAEHRDGTVVLTITDTGHGIPADDLPHVFERFFRADKSRTVSSGHAGLGLAISKAIVEAHGGTIEVSSQLGVGTAFAIRLPVSSRP
jgi:signal transduction histidine kinase